MSNSFFNIYFSRYQQLSSAQKSKIHLFFMILFIVFVLYYVLNLHQKYQKNIGQINQLIQKKQTVEILNSKIPPKISIKEMEKSLNRYDIKKIHIQWENELTIEVIGDFVQIIQWLENTQFKVKQMYINKNQLNNQQVQIKFVLI